MSFYYQFVFLQDSIAPWFNRIYIYLCHVGLQPKEEQTFANKIKKPKFHSVEFASSCRAYSINSNLMFQKAFPGQWLALVAEHLGFLLHIDQLVSEGLKARGDSHVGLILGVVSHNFIHFLQKLLQFHLQFFIDFGFSVELFLPSINIDLEVVKLVEFSLSAVLSGHLVLATTSDIPQLVLLLISEPARLQKVLELVHPGGDDLLLVGGGQAEIRGKSVVLLSLVL